MIRLSAAELENSAPLDPDKRLKGAMGAALLDELRDRIEAWERANGSRRRARKLEDAKSFALTLETVLANLIALWLNRVDRTRFLAVAFDANAYVGLELSVKAMRVLRDAMEAEGLIEVAPGFRKVDVYEVGKPIARRTRIRAATALIEEFQRFEVHWGSIRRVAERALIVIRDRRPDAGPEPADVRASADVLCTLNARLATATLSLPSRAWARIGSAREEGDDKDDFGTGGEAEPA